MLNKVNYLRVHTFTTPRSAIECTSDRIVRSELVSSRWTRKREKKTFRFSSPLKPDIVFKSSPAVFNCSNYTAKLHGSLLFRPPSTPPADTRIGSKINTQPSFFIIRPFWSVLRAIFSRFEVAINSPRLRTHSGEIYSQSC